MTTAEELRTRTKPLWFSDVSEIAVNCVPFLHRDNILPVFIISKCVQFHPLYAEICQFVMSFTIVISSL
jgi:hypothetical protein